MKKLLTIALAFLCLLGMVGCSQQPQHVQGNQLLAEGNVIKIDVSSLPEGYNYSFDGENGLNDYIGAGVLRYDNMKNNFDKSYFVVNTPSSGSRIAYTMPVYLTKNQTIKVCLTWFADANGDPDDTTFIDYDVRLYNSTGDYVDSCISTENNLELLEFTVTSTDTYSIKIYQYDANTSNHRLGLAYQVYE